MTNPSGDFLSPQQHFDCLLRTLPKDQIDLYQRMKNVRVETGYRGRTFIVYKMYKREPLILDTLVIKDFECNDEEGASTVIRSKSTNAEITVGYTPVKVGDHDLFLFMPLHGKVRWCAAQENLGAGSLGFPICIRTLSRNTVAEGRYDLREKAVTYCETGVAYAREFQGAII